MSIHSISSTPSLSSNQTVANPQRPDQDRDHDQASGVKGRHDGGHHHRGGLMADVMQTLQSMGYSVADQTTSPKADNSTANTTTTTSTTNATAIDPRQALHRLMHDLREALRQSVTSDNTNAHTPSPSDSDGDNDHSRPSGTGTQNGYNTLDSRLQNLISTLNNGTTSDAVSKLQTDFANLMSALNPGSSAPSTTGGSSTTTQPTLQSFLVALEKNVANHMSHQSGPGSLINAEA